MKLMRIIDIVNRVDKSKRNASWVDVTELGNDLNVDGLDHYDQERIKSYYLTDWMCTDTVVGARVYFFDDVPCCISMQDGRKSDEHFSWFSKEIATKVRMYLFSLLMEESDNLNIDITDPNEEYEPIFKIDYNSQIWNRKEAIYNRENVKIVKHIKKCQYGIDKELIIQFANGDQKNVQIEELDFYFNINMDGEEK